MEAFARTGEAIRATSSKLEKTRLLGEYFAGLDDETLPLAAVYFAARPFADRDQRKLNLGYAVIRNAVCEIAGVDEAALGESYMRHSDVGDVIELRRQTDDVLTVERRDEGLVQVPDDLVVELVAVMLDRVDFPDLVLDVGEVSEELRERLGRLDGVLGVLLEEHEEFALPGQKR